MMESVELLEEIVSEPVPVLDYTELLEQMLQAQYVLIVLFAAFLIYMVFFRKGR